MTNPASLLIYSKDCRRYHFLAVLLTALLFIQLPAGGKDLSTIGRFEENLNLACTPPNTSQFPSSNLQIRYPFNGNMNDVSGTGNHALPQYSPTLTTDRFSVPNSAYAFDGSTQWMATTNPYNNPTVFSIGLWFKTTSTSGGGLMGFCDNQTSTGFTNRDRVIYMNNVGQLEFGVYPGYIVTLKTPESYNDGVWHFAAATFSSAGMKLYVDGLLKLVNTSVTTAQSMTGYWRLGYFDLTTGWSTASSNYFNGSLDDVFYYDRELSSSEILNIYEVPDGAGSDSPKCAGETLSFKGVSISGATYSWTGPGGFNSTSQNPVLYNISSANQGVYYLTITDGTGCSTSPIPVHVRVPTVTIPLNQAPSSGLVSKFLFTGGNLADLSGNGNTAILQNSPPGTAGRFGFPNNAYALNGSDQYITTTNSFTNPNVFTIAVWFKTTTTTGGRLIGFGNSQTGLSTQSGRHIYMTNSGQLIFGVFNSGPNYVTSGGEIYNDGQWHCAVGTLSSAGMNLYVDGVLQGSDPSVITAQNFSGYWRIGYDDIPSSWPSPPTSKYFNGFIDDVYIYNIELPASSIAKYNSVDGAGSNEPFCSSGGTLNLTAPSLTGSYSYNWTGPNGFVSVAQNPSLSSITTSNAGLYTLTVTTTSSCPAKAYVNVRIDTPPAAPTVTANSRCGPGTIAIGAGGSPLKYRWYAASSGGNSLAGASVYSPNLSTTSTFYVSSVNATGCESSGRTSVVATIYPIPAIPTGKDTSRCGPGTLLLKASGSSIGYKWYNAGTGGTLLGTGSSFTTPSISVTTTFYVASLSVDNCESARVPVIATINSVPAAATQGNASRCGSGTVTLTATGSPSSYNWYAASTGGIPIGNGGSFSTPSISATTTYYVVSLSSANCESTSRTPVIATVDAIPADPSGNNGQNCGPGSVVLTASGSPFSYNWYAGSTGGIIIGTGGTFTSPSISTTTTYFVSALSSANCESASRIPVIATINVIPAAPSGTTGQKCGPGSVNISAAGSPSNYNWYASSTGGPLLGTGAIFSTPSINSTTTYYVSSVSSFNCESVSRTPVVATINAIPANAIAANVQRCGAGSLDLTASGSPFSYNWYTASTGGSPAGSGAVFTTPSLSSTTTYYVVNVSGANCESAVRTPVIVTINSIPASPVAIDGQRCGPGSVVLGASGSPSSYNWYDAPTGGPIKNTGPGFTLPPISVTTTYYVTALSSANCESSPRIPVKAIINVLPNAPSVTNVERCGTGTVLLSASGSSSGYNWYTTSTGGIPSGPASSYTTPSLSVSTDFYVTSLSPENCESVPRTLVKALINPIPPVPSATNVATCGPGSVTLTASGSSSSYNWYTSSTGPTPVFTGLSFTTPSLSASTTYYVSSLSASNCESTSRISVVAIVNSLPPAPTAVNGEICNSGTTTLSATGSPYDYRWYSSPSGGPAIGAGNDFDTPDLSSTTSFYVSSLDTNQCESAARTTVTARVNAVPSSPSASGDSICSSGTATLSASGSLSGYRWYAEMTGDNLLASTSSYSTFVNADTVFYVCSEINNCESGRIPVPVVVSPSSNPGTLSGSQTVCKDNNNGILELTGYTGKILKWEGSNDAFMSDQTDLGNTTDQYSYTNLSQTYSYRVQLKSGSCPLVMSSVATVTVDPSPPSSSGFLSKDTLVPSGNNSGEVILTNYVGNIIGWEVSNDHFATYTSVNRTLPNFLYDNLASTTSYRAVVQSGVCAIVKSNIVTISVDPPLKLVADTVFTTLNRSLQSAISVLANDYLGSFYQLLPISSQTTGIGGTVSLDAAGNFTYTPPAEFTGIDKITYTVCDKATGTFCLSTELVFIVKDTVIVYSSITPNGDGKNDYWIIDGIHMYKDNSVKIINRWGDLVYEQANYDNRDKVWKGESNSGFSLSGKQLPDGTYFYSIDLKNGSKPLTGYVVIKQY